ncbi:MAG: Tryptophan synthase alpha chain [Myxococcaceae bacterium]|nr:Tryptophan synthase alpha chain [Myxococcaceae bacterium]
MSNWGGKIWAIGVVMLAFVPFALEGCGTAGGPNPAVEDAATACPTTRVQCDGTCVNLSSDAENCGRCGNRCGPGMGCGSGRCVGGCSAPGAMCGAACVDPQSDVHHCGACDRPCEPGVACMAGACQPTSARDCTGRECGPDGAGGSCGTCPLAGWSCNVSGRCVAPDMACRSMCAARQCGADPGTFCAGRSCGTCPAGSTCNGSGQCLCTRGCAGRECGDDGCGGVCGTCAVGRSCVSGSCVATVPTCTSACGARMCGPDVGAGCAGRTCGSCPAGYRCNATGTGCDVDPSALWVITVLDGAVSGLDRGGETWDPGSAPDSAPDAYVCLTIDGRRSCAPTRTNSYRPFWNTVFSAAPARVFTAGIRVEFADEDTAFDDDICAPATIPFTAAAFSGATLTIGCAPYGTFNYRLTPAP